jgi:catechol 2,3-dioxygenase
MTIPTSSNSERSSIDPVLAKAPHRISKVTLVVRDLDRVAGFYRDVIGLRETSREAGILRLGTDAATLVELRQDPSARVRSPRDAGLFHTAFLLPERSDLGAWLAFAAERRVSIHGASDHLVSEAIYLADPEGNGIEIYADRPPQEWRWRDGLVEMATDALDVPALIASGGENDWQGFPTGSTVGHVHLQVGSLAPAEEFYAGVLGLEVTCRYPGGIFYAAGGYHHHIATNIWNSRGAPVRTPSTGLAEVEILAPPETLDAIGTRAGKPADARLTLLDPWGTPITIAG